VKVLCAMSGGVDSSVAAAELVAAGHEVVGVTMRLWGGDSDTGCCSIADVDDARRVTQQLGIDHLVFNFTEEFDEHVVDPYVSAHANGITPNPCIECNRHLKFARLSDRADLLGFDAVATGHHARIVDVGGSLRIARGADPAKDQSYVVHMLPQRELARTMFPVGHLTKAEVRAEAAELGLRTATKPDSQDVCFITEAAGRARFLGDRIPFRRAQVVDDTGRALGEVPAVELVTVGQRRGIGVPGGGEKRYVLEVRRGEREGDEPVVVVGAERDLDDASLAVSQLAWAAEPLETPTEVMVQCSAHGTPQPAVFDAGVVVWRAPQRRVSPGQSVVIYDSSGEWVHGGGIATARSATIRFATERGGAQSEIVVRETR
jgi:tRNA-specific 2-thiouridylase